MSARRADLVIRRGTVVDGTGADSIVADVAISGDRITAVGDLTAWTGQRELDAADRVVCPGFIDTHSHDDRALLTDPAMAFKASQGVTTVVAGNCGISLAPFVARGAFPDPMPLLGDPPDYHRTLPSYRAALQEQGHAVNVVMLTGHSMLRAQVMEGGIDRPADAAELARMQDLLEAELAAGSAGLSTGLEYPAARHSSTEEVATLASVMREVPSAVYASHIRDEGAEVLDALDEAFRIGMAAATPTVVSHHKCSGNANHGRSVETLAAIDAAAKRQTVVFDVYPYTAGSTVLDPARVRQAERVIISSSQTVPEAAGRSLDQLAAEWGTSVEEATERLRPAAAVYFLMAEEDLEQIISHPRAMIGSDGIPGMPHPHPRLWGTFTRVLAVFVRKRGLIPLPEAIRRMTSLPATTFGLRDRGTLTAGAAADVVVFDPATVSDQATYDDPTRASTGIDLVVVNGQPIITATGPLDTRPGRFLARAD